MPNPLSEQLWNSSPEQLDRLLAMPRTADRSIDHKPEGA